MSFHLFIKDREVGWCEQIGTMITPAEIEVAIV